MLTRIRWRHATPDEMPTVTGRLSRWPSPAGGDVRHMFPLAAIDEPGAATVRVAEGDGGWAACVLVQGSVVVPCGDPEVIASAGVPLRRWRLLVGDADAADALLGRWGADRDTIVHAQRFQVVEPALVPDDATVPDPGLRRAHVEDVPGLVRLALQLHVDDRYGPHPGRAGARAYRQRMERAVPMGTVWCVGPLGRPVAKIERSVDDLRWGVQLAGICVLPEARGQGLGTAAVAAAVRSALLERPGRPVTLHVRADNGPALGAYRAAGFVDREEWRLAVRP